MSEPSAAVQGALYSALTNDSVLTTLLGGAKRVFDIVPPNPPVRYITIGEDQTLDEGNLCDPDIFEHFSTIHVWCRAEEAGQAVGRIEAKNIAGRAREILKRLTPAGFSVKRASCERLDHLRDPDGLTAHSVLTMRFLITVA